ncbi:TPA: helix-turn-helix transcriptional regulator [Streptococcus agalactiae]|uniref:helix-turn-helix domain-containing protein n=1 Tax=Streptococcus agalactiae TaxID=1311 RepID=UPI00133124BF|nr:helix-turn-helix transcriptional regulator [Streptococcus agalactiae]KAF1201911.1 transcriptional regulator [Streptococcus agalactiae]KAF1210404.1 transcriptional regulator [Streptococcus agalactiae]KAF1261937.1 transcriptional regulator [Streptococcus agalactiae]KAF1270429.1 transcriptional regulator [Streptococcus agalactiae]HEM9618018.1 helix-turn-helix transcriptional regulator [Streptococcus agalactiae]
MFPERLKELRKKSNLTQKDMAEYFGTSQPSYQAWESGKRNPNSESLDKIANFFNVSTDYLLGNTDLKNPDDLDIEKVKESLKKSLGYNGTSDIPEDELESMAQAFIEHFKNQ